MHIVFTEQQLKEAIYNYLSMQGITQYNIQVEGGRLQEGDEDPYEDNIFQTFDISVYLKRKEVKIDEMSYL